MTDQFRNFFQAATGAAPYPYQEKLAVAEGDGGPSSLLINVPTGAGKIAGVPLFPCHSNGRRPWTHQIFRKFPKSRFSRALPESDRIPPVGWQRGMFDPSERTKSIPESRPRRISWLTI